ncbi:gem-associated protein 5-like isoform X2 [Aricia agestis]|uniref:gem-associated protein 5-like isoform X2 n=1 Tax=Aricia agestis TaxID=91739 RepID=UPI001C2062B7|nr:gem-associated protein 5-like isoform X2 [Aricia agestis]
MEETLLFPSPNWFQTSGLKVTRDGWLIYGGPSKSLCLLQPLHADDQGIIIEDQRFKAHFLSRAHAEKIVSVDVSPRWPEKMNLLTGSADGSVKQWNIEATEGMYAIKSTHSHNTHLNEKEEVASVGYSDDTFAVTVGVFGNIVKWDLNSNIVKEYSNFLKNFRPTSMACSQHIQLNVAIGTKQGLVFVLDLNGPGKLLYKVRAQDEEIFNVSWCPQYEVLLKKSLQESDRRTNLAKRLGNIRNIEPEPENLNKSGRVAENLNKSGKEAESLNNSGREKENLNKSGRDKNLPEDSFDQSVVEEEDLFDVYKDHEADEFGHKKFEPIDILVKVKEEKVEEDFLSECNKLKEDILRRKNEPEPTIQSLVEALDNTHVGNGNETNKSEDSDKNEKSQKGCESSVHVQKHLLATISRHGAIRIWSKSGKLVAGGAINIGNKNKKSGPVTPNLLWLKSDVLLLTDGKNQLLECNPLKIDCKNKLEWKLVHTYHKTGLYGIASNAPKVQVAEESDTNNWLVWTAAQDRNLVCYSLLEKKKVAMYNTCGGFIYNIQPCPYDASKVAVAVGDGAVRVWEAEVTEDETLRYGRVLSYWQNVQGKVLTVAWHPTRENLLAFATAEARVGTIDTSGKNERPARTLTPALRGGVYSLCWGEDNELYACGGGECVVYRVDKPDADPTPLKVEWEGRAWSLSVVCWRAGGLLCGDTAGAVALLDRAAAVLTATAVFSKMIHSIQIHPEQTSNSNTESPYKNMFAVCSLDKSYNIAILEIDDTDKPSLRIWKTLSGHKGTVLQLAWSPHHDGRLMSTSQDGTVRVWDISTGACTSIFGGGGVGAAWHSAPGPASTALSGGADCALRAWSVDDHPADRYIEVIQESKSKKKNKDRKHGKKEENGALEAKKEETSDETNEVAVTLTKTKVSKKFLLPIISKQLTECNVHSVKKLAKKFLDEEVENGDKETKIEDDNIDTDFVKMFGSTNDLNEILDLEMDKHLESHRLEAWTMLGIFRGRVDDVMQFNARRDRLCPFLVSQAPAVSPKYWKDVMTMYLAQMDRLAANQDTDKIEARSYGGSAYRRAALQLSVHDARAALASLAQLRLYKEAYVLARVRHMTTAAEGILREWAEDSVQNGNIPQAAVCYLALGDAYKASTELARMNNQEFLKLAADLAKAAGQHTFANHLAEKTASIQNGVPEPEDDLKPLPTRMELLQIKAENLEE